MTVEELSKIQSQMPTSELVRKTREWNTRLCRSGGRDWTLRVPVSENDPDMLIGEVCRRLETLEAENAALRAIVKEMERITPFVGMIEDHPNGWEWKLIKECVESLQAALDKINETGQDT